MLCWPYIVDIDECAEDNGGCLCDPSLDDEDGCVADCINLPGSHECDCRDGYRLAEDFRTCVGMCK